VDLRNFIETTFSGKAFSRPLFYAYPGGLRFELSEGGTAIELFLVAMRKAWEICSDIFPPSATMAVCLRLHAARSETPYGLRRIVAQLKEAGIAISRERSIWAEPINREDWFDESDPEAWVNVAFRASTSLIPNLLWCAFASGNIRPCLHSCLYLFNIEQRVMVWPYDDRGMDVVGPNHALLASLFRKHRRYLLEHDIEVMCKTFNFESTSSAPSGER